MGASLEAVEMGELMNEPFVDPPEPDWETEEDHFCFHCDETTTHAIVAWDGRVWKTCEDCLHEDVVTEAYEPEPEFDDYRQEEIARER